MPSESAPTPLLLRPRDNSAVLLVVSLLIAAIFVIDLFTPLGVAVWFLYVVPVGLTVLLRDQRAPLVAAITCTALIVATILTDSPGIAAWIAYINRGFGAVVTWSIAFLVRSLIISRTALEADEWVRTIQSRVLSRLQGEFSLAQIGERALGVLADDAGFSVQALYSRTGPTLQLMATHGLRAGADVPATIAMDDSMVGRAVRSERPLILSDLPEGAFPIRSAFAHATPRHLIITPLVADNVVHGVLEAGLLAPPDERVLQLLAAVQDRIAVAIRTGLYRDQLSHLLEETQRQAEALQSQQEELRVANEELEEQSQALKNSAARLEDQQGELEATNVQLEERTADLERQRRALVASKREAERASQYKSEFLANMSHELRTPLNSTLILAKLLAQNKDQRLSADEVRYAETIHQAGNNLLALINDILDLSKIEAGAVDVVAEPVPMRTITEAIARTFRPLADEKSLALRVDVEPGVPDTLNTDAMRLQQVLNNLLSNAIKFTERGSVILTVRAATDDRVEFAVKDSGPGIPEEQHEIIFEAFRQADGSTHRTHGGTGLGLSISQELARLLGGELTLQSELGAGSTFRLVIPVEYREAGKAPSATKEVAGKLAPPPPPSPRRTPPAPPAVRLSKGRAFTDDRDARQRPGRLILVVEDDPNFARILYDLAHELEFDCVVTASTEEGMALARDLSPSGILLDVSLPDGSGLTLLDRLKRNPDTRHIPVHVASVTDNTQTALALGAVGYAVKPVDRDELVRAIQRLEQRSEHRDQRVLVVEDDPQLRDSIRELLRIDGVEIQGVGTAREALERLSSSSFDCVVLDLTLPDASGYQILETMSENEQYSFPPVIVYTGRPISPEDEARLRKYSRSVIVKGAKSPERLLDEVTLFLHQVESRLPPESQRLLREARERDEFFQGKRILIVEDDVRNIFALTSIFEPRGAKVIIARNGREGVDRVKQDRPDLVLMDIMMPEMDGLTAMREIRALPGTKDLPIVALTAKAMRDDYEECLAAGANDYLAKPLDVDKLISLCRVWMAR